jgi:hypothetical protein
LSDEARERIPDHWYEKTATRFVCLNCKRTFSREYRARNVHGRKKTRGANMLSLWAWFNFRKHLLKCWGWGAASGRDSLDGTT